MQIEQIPDDHDGEFFPFTYEPDDILPTTNVLYRWVEGGGRGSGPRLYLCNSAQDFTAVIKSLIYGANDPPEGADPEEYADRCINEFYRTLALLETQNKGILPADEVDSYLTELSKHVGFAIPEFRKSFAGIDSQGSLETYISDEENKEEIFGILRFYCTVSSNDDAVVIESWLNEKEDLILPGDEELIALAINLYNEGIGDLASGEEEDDNGCQSGPVTPENAEEIIANMDEILSENPDDENALLMKSIALATLRKFDDAIKTLDRALAENPNDYCLLINKGAMCHDNHDDQTALSCFEKALILNPGDWMAIQHVISIDPELRKLAEDRFSNKKSIRISAIDSLGTIKSPFSSRLLIDIMMDDDDDLQTNAQEALIKIGVPAMPLLYYAYERSVRVALVLSTDAMRKIGPGVIPYLESIRNEDNEEMISDLIEYVNENNIQDN